MADSRPLLGDPFEKQDLIGVVHSKFHVGGTAGLILVVRIPWTHYYQYIWTNVWISTACFVFVVASPLVVTCVRHRALHEKVLHSCLIILVALNILTWALWQITVKDHTVSVSLDLAFKISVSTCLESTPDFCLLQDELITDAITCRSKE